MPVPAEQREHIRAKRGKAHTLKKKKKKKKQKQNNASLAIKSHQELFQWVSRALKLF